MLKGEEVILSELTGGIMGEHGWGIDPKLKEEIDAVLILQETMITVETSHT